MHIWGFEPKDLNALARLHAECFPHDPWAAQVLEVMIERTGCEVLLIAPDSDLEGGSAYEERGFADPKGFLIWRLTAGEVEIITLGVSPLMRRRGLASALLNGFLKLIKALGAVEVFLEVEESNQAAVDLYLHAGFKQVGKRKGYYTKGRATPQDALVFGRRL